MNIQEYESKVVSRRFTTHYILALSTIALLSIGGHFLIFAVLEKQLDDAHVVNIAGRQRMLSQKMVKSAFALVYTEDESTRNFYLEELEEAAALWEEAGLGLRYGKADLDLPGNNSEAVEAGFMAIDSTFQIMLGAVRTLQGGANREDEQRVLELLLAHESQYLSGMDAIVFQYAKESSQEVVRLKVIERILLFVILLTLLIEGVFIFRPLSTYVREAIDLAEANTMLIQANNELEKSQIKAQKATRLKGTFLANMSHELRTPMNGVIGMTDLLMDTPLTNEQREYTMIIQSSGNNLLRFINDILDFSKIEEGKMVFEYAPFDVREMVKNTLDIISFKLRDKPVSLRSTIDQQTPQRVVGDSTRVQQVLLNLLSNAAKFTRQGEIEVRVLAESIVESAVNLRFSVRDTGIGIPADRFDYIFESFEQVDASTTRKYGGTGLGLAICKRLCEMMQGTIWVESEPGMGSTFHFVVQVEMLPVDSGSMTI